MIGQPGIRSRCVMVIYMNFEKAARVVITFVAPHNDLTVEGSAIHVRNKK